MEGERGERPTVPEFASSARGVEADTVHKVQGCTLTLAVIDLRMHASHHGR